MVPTVKLAPVPMPVDAKRRLQLDEPIDATATAAWGDSEVVE